MPRFEPPEFTLTTAVVFKVTRWTTGTTDRVQRSGPSYGVCTWYGIIASVFFLIIKYPFFTAGFRLLATTKDDVWTPEETGQSRGNVQRSTNVVIPIVPH